MKYLGVEINVKNIPELDRAFIPMGLFNKAFLKTAQTIYFADAEGEEFLNFN